MVKFQSINPANGEILWEGEEANEADVDKAVQTAQAAFAQWSALSYERRKFYMEEFIKLLTENRDHVKELISKEVGKPLWESNMEVGGMINKLKISITAFEERTGLKEKENPFGMSAVRHKPHGVLAVFGPYNFPGHLPNGHIIPALLAGNTVVFKPSELAPLVAEEIVKLWHRAFEPGIKSGELPEGVLNLVQGKANTGIALSKHAGINGLLFTGSSSTGKLLHKQLAGRPEKILALEMGGNNPLVVSKVSDLKAAAYMTIQSAFITSGQRCTCARRLILPEGQEADDFLDILVSMTKSIKLGTYGDEPEPFMGPVVSKEQALKLMEEQSKLIKKGAEPLLEMKHLKEDTGFVSPGILDSTDLDDAEDYEIFGPLLQVYRVKDFAAAIDKANDTSYGLSAGLISDQKDLYGEFYKKIRAGIVNWNNQLTGASSAAPFGGIGASGNHRPSAYYAADYCSYPVASLEANKIQLPDQLSPGLALA